MEKKTISFKKTEFIYAGLFLLTGAIVCLFSFFMGKSYEAILRNVIVSLIMSGTIIFMLLDAATRGKNGFSYDNFDKKSRFIVVYIMALVLSCALALVPNQFWPYMSFFVILALFSNNEIGMISGTFFVTLTVMLEENGNYAELFMYVIAGAVAIAVFRDLNENTKIAFPTFISLTMQAVLLVAFNVLFLNRTFGIKVLFLPILNLMLNLLILLIFLNMFGVYVIRKSNDMYMEINDSEFSLLQELKEKNPEEYYRAIHTAYLSERIALGLGFNSRAVKTCSYYHRIGIIDGKMDYDDVSHYYTENRFPLEAIEYLHEYMVPSKASVKSRETLTVQLSETVIATIMMLIKKDPNVDIDYDHLIDGIIDKMIETGELNSYDVTFRELNEMRKILKKEKLYYGFLLR
ncbi:hypothetical protein SAMN04487928_10281 [Butyrivibrio proteoclasticus]|uniref:HD domain-containing protein n=2 Tax=Butyrivibrio proteoclasticus TaxID=43305 RepID=A0A1I5QE97_9FIRM|nr:hypothetical protein SAMN04487928_10281 [Butyrivibrio proteoclasticus]